MSELSVCVKLSVVVCLISVLAGCEKVEQVGAVLADEPLTIVLVQGARIAVNGKPVEIQGHEACPKPNPAFFKFVGPAIPTVGSRTCALIAADTSIVTVSLALPDGAVTEQWKVTRNGGKIGLRHPDGSSVVGMSN